MVAEDDGQLVAAFADLPGPVEHLRIADVPPAVAPDPAVGRARQDLLVGGDPLNAVAGQQGKHRLTDRPLARPHAAGPLAEVLAMALDGPADVHLGILGITILIGRQGDVRHRLAGQPLVEQQGQDRVEERRGGQLDLAGFGQLAMPGDDLGEDFALAVEQPVLLDLGVTASLVPEGGQFGVRLEEQRMEPGQVGPDLQVAEVARVEPGEGSLGAVDPQAPLAVQLPVPFVRPDHRVREGHEEVVEQVTGILAAQAVGGHPRDIKVPVRGPVHIRLDLHKQAGHQVDRAAELGDFFQMQRHPDVVLGAVQTDPGHRVLTPDVVGVVRLMLVPHQGQANLGHLRFAEGSSATFGPRAATLCPAQRGTTRVSISRALSARLSVGSTPPPYFEKIGPGFEFSRNPAPAVSCKSRSDRFPPDHSRLDSTTQIAARQVDRKRMEFRTIDSALGPARLDHPDPLRAIRPIRVSPRSIRPSPNGHRPSAIRNNTTNAPAVSTGAFVAVRSLSTRPWVRRVPRVIPASRAAASVRNLPDAACRPQFEAVPGSVR